MHVHVCSEYEVSVFNPEVRKTDHRTLGCKKSSNVRGNNDLQVERRRRTMMTTHEGQRLIA